jgi:hypothetical protein
VDHGPSRPTAGPHPARGPITAYLAFGSADGNTVPVIRRHRLDFVPAKKHRTGMVPWQMDGSLHHDREISGYVRRPSPRANPVSHLVWGPDMATTSWLIVSVGELGRSREGLRYHGRLWLMNCIRSLPLYSHQTLRGDQP